MSDFYDKSPVRVPVRLVDGQWEYFYGGGVPAVEGTVADLIVDRSSFIDKKFLSALARKSEHRILSEGTQLLVALTIRPGLSDSLRKDLMVREQLEFGAEFFNTLRADATQFVCVKIGPGLQKPDQKMGSNEGGVWLQLEGGRPKGISVSSVVVPDNVSKNPLGSLNYAFTKLSETYEPWRLSHTGSVYTRVLYKERNGKWYPLQVLRGAAEATEEQALIKERWAAIAALLRMGRSA